MADLYIERGWEGYRKLCVPADASEIQVRETRQAYFAGAASLFYGIMAIMGPGTEPTDNDLSAMTAIQQELDAFGEQLDRCAFGGKEH